LFAPPGFAIIRSSVWSDPWGSFALPHSLSRKVVFFFPAFSSLEATAPLGILAVSTPLLRAGYQVRIVDSTIEPDFRKVALAELEDALCLAVSLVTGPMIRETLQLAREAKRLYPTKPVILGGWHPSLLPDQTLADPHIDIVVRGQGEDALLEVVQRIEAGEPLDDVPGIGFKRDGELVLNPPRAMRPIAELTPKAYELADFDAYQRITGKRWAMYTSSLACPYNCAFCTNAAVYQRAWNALPAEQAVDEMADLTARYNLELLWVVDDNFLVDLGRAVAIGEGLIHRRVRHEWSVQATTNLVARLSVDELKTLRRAGLTQICHGAESASPKVLAAMNKDFQRLDTIHAAAQKCIAAGIRPSFNIIFGFPGEGRAERRETVRFITDVCTRYPGAEFWTNIFTPYPGSPALAEAVRLGVEPPATLAGWADYFPRYTTLPWLEGREHARVQTMRDYLRVAFDRKPIASDRRSPLVRGLHRAISLPARWRLERDVYALPFELWLKDAAKRLPLAPKPMVDAQQLASEPAAC
jgi:radical SAM superfamily enzyme YgiQ (UPF0313 family)